jgi:serine/threonine-protein kinase
VSADPAPLDALRQLGAIDESNEADAVRLLAEARRSPEEGRVVDYLLFCHAQRPLPEALLLAVAGVLSDRGDENGATAVLAGSSSSPALMMRAEGRARAGELRQAIALIERVLLRDLDFPGAKERHARWCAGIGRSPQVTDRRALELTPGFIRGPSGLPFRIEREVARGGAGTVYEAEDADLGRRVALKVYHRPERDRAQLMHEARVAVALAGPGVVRVWDVDVERGWLAMQWAPGGVLAPGTLRSGAAGSAGSFVEWMVPLARALERVHAAGWVHLDVKPANALLHPDDGVVLTDFGIARRRGEASPPGSLGYVAPERMGGRAADPRDDVYGFGRILEDFLEEWRGGTADAKGSSWRALAAACTGPEAGRPVDGSSLLKRILVL